jgi:hypothetical protein
VRWLEESGDAPEGAAELLSAAAPPPAFSAAVRDRLAVGVAKTAALPLASPWKSLLAKGAFVASIGGASGLLLHTISNNPEAIVAAPAPSVAVPRVAADPDPPPAPVEASPALELPTAPVAAPKLKLDPRLAEAELLEKARALVASNPAAALKLTAAHGRDYPAGRLGAEADLIAAQALLGMGKLAEAKQRARASLARYPSGLYARQLRDIAGR